MSRKAVPATIVAAIALDVLSFPCQALANGGSTEVTVRRLEQAAPNPISALAQTGVGDQAWWLIAGGVVIVLLAIAGIVISRRRHG